MISSASSYGRDHAPDYSMQVHGKNCVINYGSWANFQRAIQQYRFIPEDWKSFDEKIFHPSKGVTRVAGYFKMYIHLALRKNAARKSHTLFRIPYRRDLYPAEKALGVGDKKMSHGQVLEWLEAQVGLKWAFLTFPFKKRKQKKKKKKKVEGDIVIDYKLPWVTLAKDNGYAHEFTVTGTGVTFVSSFNHAPLLTAHSMFIKGHLFNDNNWRSTALWTFDISLEDSRVFLLYDHVNMLTDLARSWTGFSTDPHNLRGLDYFAPILYAVNLKLVSGFEILLNANQYNVIDVHNSLEDNIYFILQSQQLEASISIPFVEYALPYTRVGFDVRTPTPLHVRMSVPSWHSLRYMSREEAGSSNFISLEELRLFGSYLYFNEHSDKVLDVMDMTVELHSPSCLLYAYYLKYFLYVKNNYLSSFQSHMPGIVFRDWTEGVSSLGHPKKVGNVMDAYVRVKTVGPVAIAVPVDLYSSERTVLATLHHLSIEVRSHASFLSLQMDASPISLAIPTCPTELGTSVAKCLRLDTLPSLEVDGFSLGFYLSYGPEPERDTYRERYNIHVGHARAQICAGQALVAVTMLQNFFHHLYNWDDELWPDVNSFNRAIRQDKLRVLMEVDVNITGLELYVSLMDSILHLSSTEGAKIHYDTRHTPLYTDVITVSVPPVTILQYLPVTMEHEELTETDEWADVANIQLGIDIRVVSRRDTWLAELKDQNEFMARNDAPTMRNLVYFQQVVKTLEDAIEQQKNRKPGDLPDHPHQPPPLQQQDAYSDMAAENKRCGRRFRASLPKGDDHGYGSDPLVFRMISQDDGRVGRGGGGGGAPAFSTMRPPAPPAMSHLKASLDPFLSNEGVGENNIATTSNNNASAATGNSNNDANSGGSSNNDKNTNLLASPRASSATQSAASGGKSGLPIETEFALIVKRVSELTNELAGLIHPHVSNPYNQKLRDRETTSIFLRVRENVVVSISPNTLSSVHRWLDAMTKSAVVVESYWDALKISLTKANFFSPKHLLETLRVSLHVPPLRLELYSTLGEHLCAGLLLNNLSLSLALEEQMAISGEGTLEPKRRRGLTNLVKVGLLKL